jgi:nicotinate-nucleotide pyrophosphorylase (carboxylating)
MRAERIVLNTLSRMSGIATKARKISDIVQKVSPGTRVAGTRKTTPMFGSLEKRALIDGGALPHRPDLSAMAMLKDNHLAALGGGPDAVLCGVEMIRERYGPYVNIEVEVEEIPSGLAAVEAGADIIMLDNFTPGGLSKAVMEIRKAADDQGKDITLEASGGITLENVEEYAPHVDIVSMGSLTYNVSIIGFKMEYTN